MSQFSRSLRHWTLNVYLKDLFYFSVFEKDKKNIFGAISSQNLDAKHSRRFFQIFHLTTNFPKSDRFSKNMKKQLFQCICIILTQNVLNYFLQIFQLTRVLYNEWFSKSQNFSKKCRFLKHGKFLLPFLRKTSREFSNFPVDCNTLHRIFLQNHKFFKNLSFLTNKKNIFFQWIFIILTQIASSDFCKFLSSLRHWIPNVF